MKRLPAAFLVAAWLAVPSSAVAQDALARAKELYVNAAYDEALAALDSVPSGQSSDTLEASQYRVFCLLALNRSDDARKAIVAMVTANPLYHLAEGQTSPRIESVFRSIRRQIFPEVVQRAYADAKASYDRHEPAAAAKFDHVVALLDDPDAQGVSALADLRTIATGFRDLTKAAALPAPEPPPPPPAPRAEPSEPPKAAGAVTDPTPAPTPDPPPVSTEKPAASSNGSPTIVPPVAIYQPIPAWVASRPADQQEFRGTLELVIDRTGHVTDVKLRKSINSRYDAELLRSARTWRFRPATKDGEPMPFVKVVDVQLIPRD